MADRGPAKKGTASQSERQERVATRLRWPPGVSKSLAVLALLSGLLTVYGLGFDRSLREDPFGKSRDALEWLTTRQPTRDLREIAVLPMGAYGELSWRPGETRWLTAGAGSSPWARSPGMLSPPSCSADLDVYCDLATRTASAADVAFTAGLDAPPLLIRAAFDIEAPSKAPNAPAPSKQEPTDSKAYAPPQQQQPQAVDPKAVQPAANDPPARQERPPSKRPAASVRDKEISRPPPPVDVLKGEPSPPEPAPPVADATPPPQVLVDAARRVTAISQAAARTSGAPLAAGACSRDGAVCASVAPDGRLRYSLNSGGAFYPVGVSALAAPAPQVLQSGAANYLIMGVLDPVPDSAFLTPTVAIAPLQQALLGQDPRGPRPYLQGEVARLADRALHSGPPDAMSRLLRDPRLATLATRAACYSFPASGDAPPDSGQRLCLGLFKGGQLLRYSEGGGRDPEASYARLPTRGELSSVLFLDAQNGYVSTIWRSEQPLPAALAWLKRALPGGSLFEWGARHPPQIFETRDGGVRWKALSYAAAPAPWVYLAAPLFLLSFTGLLGGLLRGAELARDAGIQLSGTPDTPIGWADPDPLKLKPIARALSRFVRNTQTTPPLTIAVSGVWGSGKSSLMNLVYEDLKARRVRPVWFNAWHHQKEEQLFAALLENVRKQATPPIWTVSGLHYRLRLLRHRHDEIVKALFIAALAAGAALLVIRLGVRLNDADHALTSALESLRVPAGVISFLGVAAALMSRMGMTPAVLAKLKGSASLGELSGQLSFRHRFAEEFRDAARTLRVGTDAGLVIFIDDLDRCRPENLMEIFEAVNFLTTAGPCFIFLGMEESRVVDAIASQPPISTVAMRRRETSGDSAIGEAQRQARLYLHKLINVTVAVPEATVTESFGLVKQPPAEPISPWPDRLRRWARAAPDVVAPWAVAGLLLLWAGLELNDLARRDAMHRAQAAAARPPAAAAPVAAAASATTAGAQAPAAGAAATGAPALPTPAAPVSEPPPPPDLSWLVGLLVVGPLALAVVLPILAVLRRAVVTAHDQENDSDRFLKALELWHPLVHAADGTPRGIKRHQNRLRLQAMRLRPAAETRDWLDRVFRTPEAKEDPKVHIPDAQLVALAAINEANPQLLDDVRKDRFTGSRPRAEIANAALTAFRTRYEAEAREPFGQVWPPSQAQVEAFRALEVGIITERGPPPQTPDDPARLAAE